MKIYRDVISGDEMLSDTYSITTLDDVVYEVEAKFVLKQEGDYDIGANASAEEAGEKYESNAQRVINLVDACRLVETQFDKKSYMTYIKGYMGKLKTKLESSNPARVSTFQTGAQNFVKKVLGEFGEYQFFTGEKMDPEGLIVLMRYKEDGITPYFYFFKDGLDEEKV